MSATSSSKTRLVLFLLVVIALVFFITSFVAAGIANSVATESRPSPEASCTIVQTGEDRIFGECVR